MKRLTLMTLSTSLVLLLASLALAQDEASHCSDMLASSSEDVDMTLNLETLEAETELGTLQAERAANSYVALIDDSQAIGIAFLDNDGDGNQASDQQIVVYLYHRQNLAVMTGEIDAEGAATLTSNDLSDFEASVELMVEGDTVSGTATFPGEEPTSFTTDAATGIAGVYWARGTDEDPQLSGDWVVLSDGRQWGCVCAPPVFSNPCCHLGTN